MKRKRRAAPGWRPGAAALILLASADAAKAAGGAHVIDDAEVEQPGLCHGEVWVTRFPGDGGLLNLSPACTARALPSLEFGASVQHGWQEGASTTLAGPSLKLALRRVDRGIGLGASASGSFDLSSGRLVGGAVIVPATADLSRRVRASLNAGYLWSRSGDRHAPFAGVQIEYRPTGEVALMAEGFTRDRGSPGAQAGIRWTPRSWIDLDALVGRRVDGTARTAVTLGLTIRG